ncbi:MAG: IclR family transcriptional regulator [Acetobacter sp.]|nr:IclR family transcriptional regulator [Acetobacter sp.]
MSISQETVPALRKAVRILDCVKMSQTPLLAVDIARQLDLPKSTVHGLLSVMVELGLLEKTSLQGYRLGIRLLDWVENVTEKRDLVTEFYHICDGRADYEAFTMTLATLEGMEVVYLACRNSTAILGAHFRVGLHLPAIFTAVGKIILAEMTENELEKWLALYPESLWAEAPATHETCSSANLIKALTEIRKCGYAIDDGRIYDGLWCLGAVVRDYSGQVVAGVGLSLPKTVMDHYTIFHLAHKATGFARDLSYRLGYREGCRRENER